MTKNYIQKGLHLASKLIKEKKYERAIQVLNNIALEDSSYTAYLELGKIYSKLNDYENAKKYLCKVMLLPGYNALIAKLELGKFHFKKMLSEGFSIKNDVMVYVSKLFYVGNVTNDKTLKYSEWQLLDYDPYLACEYINDKNGKYFDDSIDITKLFIDIQNYLTDEYKEGTDNLYDIYLIPYENCGKNDENYIKVATIPNTKNIISMFPYKQKILKR